MVGGKRERDGRDSERKAKEEEKREAEQRFRNDRGGGG